MITLASQTEAVDSERLLALAGMGSLSGFLRSDAGTREGLVG